jgi:PAS domain S-box-containing protein
MTAVPEPRRIDEDAAMRSIIEGTASETGTPFFRELVMNLARALDTHGAWITEYDRPTTTMRSLALWFGGGYVENLSYDVTGTPCEPVVEETRMVHIPDRIIDLYPGPPPPGFPAGEVSYLGVPLLDTDDSVMGHLAVVDVRPMPKEKRLYTVFEVFAARAAAEMRRLRLETQLRERQEKLARLIDSAMDAIVELDRDLGVVMMNSAAERTFGCTGASMDGRHVGDLLGETATVTLSDLAGELDRRPGSERHVWIPAGFTAAPARGDAFPAEATLSRFEVHGEPRFTLILRNVNDRIEAERRIHSLSAQAEYLREEIAADHGFDEIIGRSRTLIEALRNVSQVAETHATVLLLGETGTGKELFARAIHQRSARHDGPLIKVNCAAVPATLIESEFFGHERGAFTGATQRRQGRFELAAGGTIFLDEIGELPLELQGKLLRVLQEGEFEPVGGTRTRHVDVRVLAATNRDLEQAVKDGAFREDHYDRLSVFPLRLPPLRERGGDVILIAEHTIEKLARQMGRRIPPLSDADREALKTYPWPGNVRELRNVIERALITSRDGRLHLSRGLPAAPPPPGDRIDAAAQNAPEADAVLTEARMRAFERDNMIRALEGCGWRVGGPGGAADALGVSASTFKSRMKALGVERPG